MVSGLNPVDNVAKKSTIWLMHLKSDWFDSVSPQPDENVVNNCIIQLVCLKSDWSDSV